MKNMVYKRRVDTEVQLLKHIYNAARCINNFLSFLYGYKLPSQMCQDMYPSWQQPFWTVINF